MADALHPRAVACWEVLQRAGARLRTSVPVILEKFTYLDRRGSRDLSLRWQEGLRQLARLTVFTCSPSDLDRAWPFLERRDLHELSLVDATSFVLMRRNRLRSVFAFDTHFAAVGFSFSASSMGRALVR